MQSASGRRRSGREGARSVASRAGLSAEPGGVQSRGGGSSGPAPAAAPGAAGGGGRLAAARPRGRSPSPAGLACVEHLELRERVAHLLARALGSSRSTTAAHRLDPDPRLLEVALVLLGDPAGGEVEDADDALEQQVLDPDLAQLLLEPPLKLLLVGLGAGSRRARRPGSVRPPAASAASTASRAQTALAARRCAAVSATASR